MRETERESIQVESAIVLEQPLDVQTGAENIGNKEKILRAAIDLFSQRGYSGVSVREIAAVVGIKAASIYNHYSGKEGILDEIVVLFRQLLHERVYPAFERDEMQDVETFINRITQANDAFFSVPLHAQIGSIVFREQFHNEGVRRMLLEELIVSPRRAIAGYFEELMRNGKMRRMDPVFAAKEYHAFYVYRFYENSLSQTFGETDLEASEREHAGHVRMFLDSYSCD